MDSFKFGFKEGDLEFIINELRKFPQIEKGIIFGSRAKGNYQQGSDVDIAIVCKDKNIAGKISFILNEDSPLPYKFDVLDYNSISHQDLIEQINRIGIVFYSRNEEINPESAIVNQS